MDETGLPSALIEEIAAQSHRDVAPEFHVLTGEMEKIFGDSLLATILYGSCMADQDTRDGVVDLYVIVDRYRNAYRKRSLQILNAWLPPNVFYLETAAGNGPVRIKYAVLSLEDMQRGVTSWFHSYIWSRFAQPVRILYVRDEPVRRAIHIALAGAVMRFLRSTIPVLGQQTVDAESMWTNGLGLTYQAELRPEKDSRARYLARRHLGDLARITECAAPALERVKILPDDCYRCLSNDKERKRALRVWRVRHWHGRFLSVLRLAKATFTFRNCTDYAAWKIKRHTGVTIEITPRQRRHPVLFGLSVLWRLVRRGVIH